MPHGDQSRASSDDREQAIRVATEFVQTHFDDPEAVVRLVITVGFGEKTVFHFDASSPTMPVRPNVIVRHVGLRWQAALAQ